VKRLIGGEGFAEGKWPWLVSLQGKIPNRMLFDRIPLGYQRFYCGASLLNDRWLLTAAHCFTETNLGSALFPYSSLQILCDVIVQGWCKLSVLSDHPFLQQ